MSAGVGDMVFESERPFPTAAVVWAGSALVMLWLAFQTGAYGWALPAVFAGAIAILQFRELPRIARISLRDDSVVIEPAGNRIALASIESLTLASAPQAPDSIRVQGPIVIMHAAGITELPGSLEPPPADLYKAILTRLSTSGRRNANASLSKQWQLQEQKFGPDRVWTYFARQYLGRRSRRPRVAALAIALLATGGIALASLMLPDSRHWSQGVAGFFALVGLSFGFLTWLLAYQGQKYPGARVPNWRRAELVISPAGLWLEQNDLSGFLSWNEVQGVQLNRRTSWWLPAIWGQVPGKLEVLIAGGSVPIWDVYDRPLPIIADVIMSLWRGPQGSARE
ncbi:MAG TPA: hypothetical protein VHY91_16235 [Pirellulales bacterium]|jgi:hypothetical protein|nr:hypothetical protein [Pirellulales bacterium]